MTLLVDVGTNAEILLGNRTRGSHPSEQALAGAA